MKVGFQDRDKRAVGLGEPLDHGVKATEHFLFRRLTIARLGTIIRNLGLRFLGIQSVTCLNIIIVKLGTIGGAS